MTNESDTPTLDEQIADEVDMLDRLPETATYYRMGHAKLASLRELSAARQRVAELEERANYNGEQWAKSAEAIVVAINRAEVAESRATTAEAERDAIRLATIEECKVACILVSDGEVMSKHVNQASCLAARSAIAKCIDAIRQLKEKS